MSFWKFSFSLEHLLLISRTNSKSELMFSLGKGKKEEVFTERAQQIVMLGHTRSARGGGVNHYHRRDDACNDDESSMIFHSVGHVISQRREELEQQKKVEHSSFLEREKWEEQWLDCKLFFLPPWLACEEWILFTGWSKWQLFCFRRKKEIYHSLDWISKRASKLLAKRPYERTREMVSGLGLGWAK